MRWVVPTLGGSLGVLAFFWFTTPDGDEGLTIGNIGASSGRVYLNLANTLDRSGDVVLWIVQGDVDKCEALASVQPNTRYTRLSWRCPNLKSGSFKIRYGWSDYNSTTREKTNVANRIQIR